MHKIDYVTVGECRDELENLTNDRRTIIVTDTNVKSLYPELFEGKECIVMDAGEGAKNLTTYHNICKSLLEMGADRGALLVGVGGGVVTDMTGFVGSTYMRGISFGFVATTLLAQIDASIGGKNGVDFEGYKNIMGTFCEPEFVLCDPRFLKTLPEKELNAGYGELIKYMLLRGEQIFETPNQENIEPPTTKKTTTITTKTTTPTTKIELNEHTIAKCVEAKMSVVKADFKEKGARKLLNLGHTIAHAIEKCTTQYNHGEAVSIGLCAEARIAQKLGILAQEEYEKVVGIVKKQNLPTQIPTQIPTKKLLDAIYKDKKRTGDTIDIVLLRNIGNPTIISLSFEALFDAYNS